MPIRAAVPSDVPVILRMIKALAEYEKEPESAKATEEQMHVALFAEQPTAYCELVDVEGDQVVAFALWFKNFSTWTGTAGIYLEDLFVLPEHRGKGYGKALLVHLAQKCIANGWHRFQWWVLDWNEPSIEFYRALGAEAMDEWTVYRVSGDALQRLADSPHAFSEPSAES